MYLFGEGYSVNKFDNFYWAKRLESDKLGDDFNERRHLRLEEVPCVLCGGNRTRKLFSVKCYLLPREHSEFNVVECLDCGLRYTNPRPVPSEIGKYYPNDYGPFQERNQLGKMDRFKQWLQRCTLELKLGYPSSKNHLFFIKWIQKLIVTAFQYYFPFLPYSRKGRLLEVGCGTGRLLALMKYYGWETYGVELNSMAADYAREKRNLHIFQGTLIEQKFEDNFFDGVCYHHVLEHLYDPQAELQEAWRIVKPGGYLYITVPNIDSLEARIFGKYWDPLSIPAHLYHFSPKTLSLLLNKKGFKKVALKSYSPEHRIYYSFLHYLQDKWPARPIPELSSLSKVMTFFAVPFLWGLHALNKGSNLRILTQKINKNVNESICKCYYVM